MRPAAGVLPCAVGRVCASPCVLPRGVRPPACTSRRSSVAGLPGWFLPSAVLSNVAMNTFLGGPCPQFSRVSTQCSRRVGWELRAYLRGAPADSARAAAPLTFPAPGLRVRHVVIGLSLSFSLTGGLAGTAGFVLWFRFSLP